MAVIEVFAANVFILGQEATSNIKVLNVTSSLNLEQVNAETPAARDVQSSLLFSHIARTTYGLLTVNVASSLNLGHSTHPKSFSFSVSNYLALSQNPAHPFFEEPISNLILTQTVLGERALHLPQTLELVQVLECVHVRSESVEHTLNLQSLVGYYLVNRTFYVTSTPLPTPPAPVTVIPSPNQPVTETGAIITSVTGPVSHPRYVVSFEQGATVIQMPRPEIGNVERFDFTRVNRRSRGGDLILFRNESWPKTKTLSLTFNWITDLQKQQILNFMQATIGQRVTYRDHYGSTWLGFIMTPAAQVVQESLNNQAITLDFQGEKV
jgi:hypothetical protein